jgi:prevent-host-death family protein
MVAFRQFTAGTSNRLTKAAKAAKMFKMAASPSDRSTRRPSDLKNAVNKASNPMTKHDGIYATLEMTQARNHFSETVNQVAFGKERVLVTRHGKALVALVPVEDLELIEAMEDRIDVEKTRAALEEVKAPGAISGEQGLDRKARVRRARGKFAHLRTSSAALAQEKAEEAEWEDRY